ncbi:MAG: bifunctional non-ous end joining protein LigD [Verrucomicrobiota bacterium]
MPATLSFVEPMECKPVDKLPEGEEWQYEIKFDGYRAIAVKQYGEVSLFSRRGNSFNANYPETVAALNGLRAKSFVLDGELVALDEQGRHSFSLLQNAKSKAASVVFYAFDLLHFDGENLMLQPLHKRRQQLEEAFPKWPPLVQLSPLLTGPLIEITARIRQFQFEGIVAKRTDSIYRPGDEPGTWVKRKLQRSEDFIVGGFIPGAHGVDQLVVGVRKEGALHFVDSVKNGFVATTRRKVQEAIEKLITPECPFANLPEKKRPHAMDREKMKTVRWVKPKVICEIAFNEWTPSGHLRHSKFLRLREARDLRKNPRRERK